MVDEQGRLVRVFWADATCRKNYSVFGDVVSVDSTYSTNQYNMKFVPFTGVNHLQSVFLGAALLANEKIESYEWLFKTFLKAVGGKTPHLIICGWNHFVQAQMHIYITASCSISGRTAQDKLH